MLAPSALAVVSESWRKQESIPAAMQSLPEATLTAQVTPRVPAEFQDGTTYMQELTRQLAEK